ncbi:diaminopimelate epimerase [candidate division GN15 bacterium]|nr:diaminopimelate epimerase [candidate division GN15 bacterium]
MLIPFAKYHALGNDFLIVEPSSVESLPDFSRVAEYLCDRQRGIGADGILFVSEDDSTLHVELYNADGSWAEKSGNGLRIVGVHQHLKDTSVNRFLITMDHVTSEVEIIGVEGNDYNVRASLGQPTFVAAEIPVKTDMKYWINEPLAIGGVDLPITCVAIGNPHVVLFVDDFDLDWPQIGADIEVHEAFPNQTNVEFVRVIERNLIEVADWERGVGVTTSSGTGAAAAVCASVMNGFVDRSCDVQFEAGIMHIEWSEDANEILLSGPVAPIATGEAVMS